MRFEDSRKGFEEKLGCVKDAGLPRAAPDPGGWFPVETAALHFGR